MRRRTRFKKNFNNYRRHNNRNRNRKRKRVRGYSVDRGGIRI